MKKAYKAAANSLRSRRGQTAIEYVLTAGFLFGAFLAFYALYSNLVPQQFDQGAQLILTTYDVSN